MIYKYDFKLKTIKSFLTENLIIHFLLRQLKPTVKKKMIGSVPYLFGVNSGANTSQFEGREIARYVWKYKPKFKKYVIFDIGSHQGNWSSGFAKFGMSKNLEKIQIITMDPEIEPLNLINWLSTQKSYKEELCTHSHYKIALSNVFDSIFFDNGRVVKDVTASSQVIKSTPLDLFISTNAYIREEGNIWIMKLDIEGLEYQVLRESKILREFQIIQFEISPYSFDDSDNIDELLKIFEEYFHLFVVSPNGLLEIDSGLLNYLINKFGVTNLVAVQKSNE